MVLHTHRRSVRLIPFAILILITIFLTVVFLLPAKEQGVPLGTKLPPLSVAKDELAANWQPTGGPYERVIYALALGPSPHVLYAGTWGRGVYRTEDEGSSWQHPTLSDNEAEGEDLTKAWVRALAVTPNGKTIYLSNWDNSVFRSKNEGATWESIVSFMPSHDNYKVEDLLIDLVAPETIYQATRGGIYKSTDGGNSWQHSDVDPNVEWGKKWVRVLDQAKDGTLYAGTFGSGVYRSDNGGETWQAIGPQEPATAREVHSLVVQEARIWAGTRDAVYVTDDGQNWEQFAAGFDNDPRAQRIQALAQDNEGNLYAGTVDFGIYRLAFGETEWIPYNDGLRGYALAILGLVYDERVNTLYATTYGAGIYRRTGDQWEPINGMTHTLPSPAFEVQSLAFAGQEKETLLTGTFVGGVYASNDRGQSWRRWSHALPIGAARNVADIAVLDNGQTIILAGGTGIYYRSAYGGEGWERVKDGLPEGDHRVISLVQARRTTDLLYAALEQHSSVEIYRSTNGGVRWEWFGRLDTVDDLAVSDDGLDLFVVSLGYGLFRSDSQGISKTPLDNSVTKIGRQIVVVERNGWQQLILGSARQSVHVRTLDGIYSSFDGGDMWRASLRGQFETIMADPMRPGVLYATAMTDTVPMKVTTISQAAIPEGEAQEDERELSDATGIITLDQEPQIVTETVAVSDKPQYAFWISLDDGRSWQQASSSDRPLTVLTLDPLDSSRLLAGTSDGGVYYTTLDIPSPYTSKRALLGLTFCVVLPSLFFGVLLGLYLYFRVVLRLRLYPWQVWALFRRIHAWRLVSAPRNKLGSLEQLIASVATSLNVPFSPETLWNELQSLGVAAPLPQIQTALSSLQSHHLFTRDDQGKYRFSLVALAHLAARNFDRDALIDQARSANRILSNAEVFFDQAGFQVTTLLKRLFLWPESPHYRALGWLNAWLHSHQVLDEDSVSQLVENVDTGSHDLGFVILDDIPTPGAYRALQTGRLIPLSSSEIQHAIDQREAGLALERAIREGQGQEDLFDLREPLLDHLSFFGRAVILDDWLSAIKQERDCYFWGLPRSGRTSALWWLRTRTSDRELSSYINLRFRGLDWPSILRDILADLLLNLRRTRNRLIALPELGDVFAACGTEQNLGAGLDYLLTRGVPASSPHFVFFLDGVLLSTVLDRFRELAERRHDVSLVVSWDGLPSDLTSIDGDEWLPPLTSEESYTLLRTIGARLRLDFADADLEILDQAAGGHPFLLRQLGSQAARLAGRPDQASAGHVLAPGEWPNALASKRVSAEAAIQAYLQQHSDRVLNLWQALPSEIRQNLRLLAAGHGLDPACEPTYTALGLLTQGESGTPRLRIGLLEHWLKRTRS